MKITILGTGGALPLPGRAQTGVLLEREGSLLLIDCGSGVLLRLAQAKIDPAQINTVLLSHHHLDHMSDLLPLIVARWLLGKTRTSVYGPESTGLLIENLLGLYEYVRSHVEVVELKSGEEFDVEGFRVRCLRTAHGVPALAYKFDGKLTISGDTEPFAEMAQFSQGCQLLVHECSLPEGFDAPNHTTPGGLGRILAGCDVERLVITHFYPEIQGREKEVIRAIKEHFLGQVTLAEDLMRFEL